MSGTRQDEDDERAIAFDAARRLGFRGDHVRLVSWSSRSIWHIPDSCAALVISRPDAKTIQDVIAETTAARAAAAAGVATPRILADPIALPDSRYATAFEWISGRRAGRTDWGAVVREAARLSTAATTHIPILDWPNPTGESVGILGADLADVLAERSKIASSAVGRLTAAGGLVLAHCDLQPANALIDAEGRAWLLDFEFARAAPREWDPAKLLVLSRRFGEPSDVMPLLGEWRQLDDARLAACADAQEVLIVLWLLRMAREGTSGAAEEARRRAATLAGADLVWQHLS
jgi:Ser/Thr protein kinase RdoA (MazF antagonist)